MSKGWGCFLDGGGLEKIELGLGFAYPLFYFSPWAGRGGGSGGRRAWRIVPSLIMTITCLCLAPYLSMLGNNTHLLFT